MVYALKNFYRNRVANLTIRSILHFRPNAEIHVLCLEAPGKTYAGQEPLLTDPARVYYRPTKFFNMGPSVANQANNVFFSEGYNILYDILKDRDDKVLMLAEDHFFTTGQTLAELENEEFDAAYAPWNTGANGSILCLRPKRVGRFFPISEERANVEGVLGWWVKRIPNVRVITTRNELDYKGDGYYANTYDEIEPAVRVLTTTDSVPPTSPSPGSDHPART